MKKKKTVRKGKKKKDFFDKVYKIVAKIPYGKVATYGDIAEACGIRSSARTVGWALNGAKETGLPCHRVVNRFGALTGRVHFGSYDLMEELLKSEGIEFDKNGCVKLNKHLWKPGRSSSARASSRLRQGYGGQARKLKDSKIKKLKN
ncbi:MAG: 6-O-methylguanine DNA methyltransferase [Ignavibacteria bacterium GWA2_35_9]|nr:MAG: 6-O-methylguanine DNA methyltransferase [Ignavibacteria bacterium GWA2_35_9]OGU48433.1 MAG: 6-O-methylguanine DNA methyltransferase [Ignavibacteria bacterium GWB2_36_8]OGU53064.1 MAG: 6-O-methylguanine DNA methyltransferase [Ignavibacteria bacterium GWC2_36_12]OGV14643.1 MAG: 6-O-methylguanine DNA methyltransferase [Ignavibacteria bacterium RIFOXYA2_FULL_37_17]